jgi:hypothetical protein
MPFYTILGYCGILSMLLEIRSMEGVILDAKITCSEAEGSSSP